MLKINGFLTIYLILNTLFACSSITEKKVVKEFEKQIYPTIRTLNKKTLRELEELESVFKDISKKIDLPISEIITLKVNSTNLEKGINIPIYFLDNSNIVEILKAENKLVILLDEYFKKLDKENNKPEVKLKKVKENGFPLKTLLYMQMELPFIRDCGYSEQELKSELINLKYKDFVDISKYTDKSINIVFLNKAPKELKSLGYSLKEVYDAGLFNYTGFLYRKSTQKKEEEYDWIEILYYSKTRYSYLEYVRAGYSYLDFVNLELLNSFGFKKIFKESELVDSYSKSDAITRLKIARQYFLDKKKINYESEFLKNALVEDLTIEVNPIEPEKVDRELMIAQYLSKLENAFVYNNTTNNFFDENPLIYNLPFCPNEKIDCTMIDLHTGLKLLDGIKTSLLELKKANYTVKELNGKVKMIELKKAGYTIEEIKKGSSVNTDIENYKEAGFSLKEIKSLNFYLPSELAKTIFTKDAVKAEGFTLKELRSICIKRNTTFTLEENLKNNLIFVSDKSLKAFKEAGFYTWQIKDTKLFKDEEIKNIGFSKDELDEAGIK